VARLTRESGPAKLIKKRKPETCIQLNLNYGSSFDFSVMEMEITALNTVTQETTPTPRIDNRDLRVEKAQKLKEMDLTREHLHAILPVSTLDKLIESTTFCVAPTKKAD
jgi:hypothetical protein